MKIFKVSNEGVCVHIVPIYKISENFGELVVNFLYYLGAYAKRRSQDYTLHYKFEATLAATSYHSEHSTVRAYLDACLVLSKARYKSTIAQHPALESCSTVRAAVA